MKRIGKNLQQGNKQQINATSQGKVPFGYKLAQILRRQGQSQHQPHEQDKNHGLDGVGKDGAAQPAF